MPNLTVCVIMAGGTGERFWPASRGHLPKQFLRIGGPRTLFQEAVARALPLAGIDGIYPVTGADYVEFVHGQAPDLPPENVLIEPMARDTAACLALAAFELMIRFPGADPVMVVLPSDHVITDLDAFERVARAAIAVAEREDCLVTLGIPPASPATCYGYIHLAPTLASCGYGQSVYEVKGFREKPNPETAQDYLQSGDYLWNSGMFIWRLSVFMALLAKHLPGHYKRLAALYASGRPDPVELAEIFSGLERISVDYGILERTTQVKVIPAEMGWDDLGNWSSIAAHLPQNGDNAASGGTTLVDTHGCIIYSEQGHIATVGLRDTVVVRVGETVLVCPKSRAQDVKQIVAELRRHGRGDLI